MKNCSNLLRTAIVLVFFVRALGLEASAVSFESRAVPHDGEFLSEVPAIPGNVSTIVGSGDSYVVQRSVAWASPEFVDVGPGSVSADSGDNTLIVGEGIDPVGKYSGLEISGSFSFSGIRFEFLLLSLLICVMLFSGVGTRFLRLLSFSRRIVLSTASHSASISGLLAVSQAVTAAQIWNSQDQFSLSSNPNGVWSYARKSSAAASGVTLFNQVYQGSIWWLGNLGHGAPGVSKGGMWAKDNSNGMPTVRFTAPESGNYRISVSFEKADSVQSTHTVYVVSEGEILFSETLAPNTGILLFNPEPIVLQKGEWIDLVQRYVSGPTESSWIRYSANVEFSPLFTITTQPSDQQIPVGGTAVFSVAIDGSSPAEYQWFFNGQPIPMETSSELRLEDLRFRDQGDYSARVTVGSISLSSRTARLSVLEFKVDVYTAVEIHFPTDLGRSYQIQRSDDLLSWQSVEGPVSGSGMIVKKFLSTIGGRSRFYRVQEIGQ